MKLETALPYANRQTAMSEHEILEAATRERVVRMCRVLGPLRWAVLGLVSASFIAALIAWRHAEDDRIPRAFWVQVLFYEMVAYLAIVSLGAAGHWLRAIGLLMGAGLLAMGETLLVIDVVRQPVGPHGRPGVDVYVLLLVPDGGGNRNLADGGGQQIAASPATAIKLKGRGLGGA